MQFSIEHLGLPARDTVALKDWYVRVLGASVVFTDAQSPPMFLLKCNGNVMIEIYAGERAVPDTANNKVNGWRHVALRVESLESAKSVLQQRGVLITEEIRPAGGGGRVLFFSDPEGNLLHLVERSQDSPVR